MKNISNNILDLVGKTPLVRLSRIEELVGSKANIIGKLEYFNPGGSVKDRIAKNLVEDAEKRGVLVPGSTIIEPTSGNTGIGLAQTAAAKGYKLILTMPESMSIERRKILKAYGAELVLTDKSKGMKGAIAKAEELAKEIDGSFIPQQFNNPANPEIHRLTTALEILKDTEGEVDIFVAGVGTGGTISGVGEVLKEKVPGVKIVAVEPTGSPVISGGSPGGHSIQGIGAGFIPNNLKVDLIDEVVQVSNEEAFEKANLIAKNEGILVGISAGAALHAATVLSKLEENKGKNIVVILPDTGERYLSTTLFSE